MQMTKLWLNYSYNVNLLWPIAIFSGLDKMSLTVIQTAKCIVAPRIFKDHWKLASMVFLRTSLFRNMTATKHLEKKNKHLFLEVYLNPRNSEHTGWLYNSCCLNCQQSCYQKCNYAVFSVPPLSRKAESCCRLVVFVLWTSAVGGCTADAPLAISRMQGHSGTVGSPPH